MPTLLPHVAHIIAVRTDKKMRRVHATANVTIMKNMHPGWNGPNIQFVRNSMGSAHVAVYSHSPIPEIVATGSPEPAYAVRLGDEFLFKPIFDGRHRI